MVILNQIPNKLNNFLLNCEEWTNLYTPSEEISSTELIEIIEFFGKVDPYVFNLNLEMNCRFEYMPLRKKINNQFYNMLLLEHNNTEFIFAFKTKHIVFFFSENIPFPKIFELVKEVKNLGSS